MFGGGVAGGDVGGEFDLGEEEGRVGFRIWVDRGGSFETGEFVFLGREVLFGGGLGAAAAREEADREGGLVHGIIRLIL